MGEVLRCMCAIHRVMRRGVSVLFFTLCSVVLNAQPAEFVFDHLGTDAGLSNLVVTSIYQDHRGFMWFGTFYGLNRYDGYEIKTYFNDPKDSLSLSDNRITCIFEDSFKNLWVGTNLGGLNLYVRDKDHFIQFRPDAKGRHRISSQRVESIFQDHNGNLWVATNNGLNLFNYKSFQFESFYKNESDPSSINNNYIYAILEYDQREIWILTNGNQLNKYNGQPKGFHSFTLDERAPEALNSARLFFKDHTNNVWIGTFYDGLLKYNGEGLRQYKNDPQNVRSISHNLVKAVLQDRNGTMWIGTDGGGLNIYNKRSDDFLRIQADEENPESLNSNAIYALYEDRSGIIWIGTFGGGVNIYDPNKARFLNYLPEANDPGSLSHKSVLAFLEDSDNNIWIGTDGGGLNLFNRKTNSFEHFLNDPKDPNSLSSNVVKSIYQDRRGVIWVGTYLGGLNRFDPIKRKFKRIVSDSNDPSSPGTSIIWRIYEDSRGNLWLSTLGNGIHIYNRTTETFRHLQPYSHNNALNDYNVISFLEDSQGEFWVLTEDQGINIFNYDTGLFSYLRHNPDDSTSLSSDHAWVIFETRKKEIWIGTSGGGLNRFNRKTRTFDHFTVKDGLPSNVITNIIEDKLGNLWITTPKGLTRIDINTMTCKNFNSKDGLQSNDFNLNAAMVSDAGELYFGGLQGFNVFDPNEIRNNPFMPDVVITGFQIFNKPVQPGDANGILQTQITEASRIVISHRESVISFRFAALNFTSPEKNQFAYRLEGFEQDWNEAGERREVTYTNLDPGKYTFRVKASNNDGLWNNDGASLQLIVTPPWWQKPWFKVLLSTFIIFSIAGVMRLRTRTIREKLQHEKEHALTLKESQMREERLQHEKAMIELSKSKLENEVSFKNSELASTVMSVVRQNETLLKIREDIDHAIRGEDKDALVRHLKKIVKTIGNEVKPDQNWNQFELLFNQIHENFLQRLKERFPDLTSRDLKLCAYLRMNLNSKEIAPLLSLSIRGVEDLRYRVRKKMGLDTTVNLTEFILTLA